MSVPPSPQPRAAITVVISELPPPATADPVTIRLRDYSLAGRDFHGHIWVKPRLASPTPSVHVRISDEHANFQIGATVHARKVRDATEEGFELWGFREELPTFVVAGLSQFYAKYEDGEVEAYDSNGGYG